VTVGVLALQGAFDAHAQKLQGLGVETREIRTVAELDDVSALIMPGGESTTMSMLLESSGLFDAISSRLADGMGVFGTCAGLILLAATIEDGRSDQRCFGRLDVTVQRNGYGRQVDSFETEIDIDGLESPAHAVFIRAPRIVETGSEVDVLATARGDAVLVRQGNALAAAFHPELSEEDRLHRLFLETIAY